MPYPSSERLIVFVLALCLSLICEVDLCMALCLSLIGEVDPCCGFVPSL